MCEGTNGKTGCWIKRKEIIASNFSKIIDSQEYMKDINSQLLLF